MWKRDTFHNCALELDQISSGFRHAHEHASPEERLRGNVVLNRYSLEGVALLRSLALAVRSEQDYGMIPQNQQIVGSLLQRSTESFFDFDQGYAPPYDADRRLSPLPLREALNKIAHADPRRGSYRTDALTHEILIGGELGRHSWIAVISLPALSAAILALPDNPI
jgi:hypothetical protein